MAPSYDTTGATSPVDGPPNRIDDSFGDAKSPGQVLKDPAPHKRAKSSLVWVTERYQYCRMNGDFASSRAAFNKA